MQRPSGRVDTGAGNNSGRGVAEGEEEQARWASRETGTTYGVLDKCGQRAGNGLCSNTLSCVLHRACVLRASCVRRACVVLLASCLLLRVSLHEKCEVAATAFRLTSVGWRLGCSGIVVDAACRQARATSQCKSLWSNQARPIDAQREGVALPLSTASLYQHPPGSGRGEPVIAQHQAAPHASVRLRSRAVFDDHPPLPKVETQRLRRAESEIATYRNE